ncbi:hypothetical protein M8J75_008461 [Diaphorina citri]|nr:hypothetical protein M8J75_008461 [Diaphorina citri]
MLKMNTGSEYSLLEPLNFTSNISYNFNDTNVISTGNNNINYTTFIKLYDDSEDEPENFTLYLNQSNDISIQEIPEKNYWALILIWFPILTIFGNILVIASVYRERTLQTVTNYFIVSLALADLLVAVVVMPFAVYVLTDRLNTMFKFKEQREFKLKHVSALRPS